MHSLPSRYNHLVVKPASLSGYRFVSGYRFSDTTRRSKSDAPLGAVHACALLLLLVSLTAVCSADVLKVTVNDAIHPVTVEYISRALALAAANHDQAVLIEINTPGGLVDSTREIIEKIVASPVPVIIYVTPERQPSRLCRILHPRIRRHRRHGPRNQHRRRASRHPRQQDG